MAWINPTQVAEDIKQCFSEGNCKQYTCWCCCDEPPPLYSLSNPLLQEIKNHYILIELKNDLFKAKADINTINPKDVIQKNENLIKWESDTVDHFVFTSTKNPVVFKKNKHVFQYKNKWLALLLINLEQIPCPIPTYEYILNARKIDENKPSEFIIVVKEGTYKPSALTLKNLANGQGKLGNVNLISSQNNIFF